MHMNTEEAISRAKECAAFLYARGYMTNREYHNIGYRIKKHRDKFDATGIPDPDLTTSTKEGSNHAAGVLFKE